MSNTSKELGLPDASDRAEESELVQACRRGDEEAFERFVDLYQNQVFGMACRLLRDREDAEEVAQEVFLSCYRHFAAFRGESRLSTWVYRITLNQVKNRWKYRQRHARLKHESLNSSGFEEDGRVAEPADKSPGPVERAKGHEMLAVLNGAMAKLPIKYQEIITLRFSENLSYDEIASVLDCSIGTVKSRICRARGLLREQLGELLD